MYIKGIISLHFSIGPIKNEAAHFRSFQTSFVIVQAWLPLNQQGYLIFSNNKYSFHFEDKLYLVL